MNVLHLKPSSRPTLGSIVAIGDRSVGTNMVVIVYRSCLDCASLFDKRKEKLITLLDLLEFIPSRWILIRVISSSKLG